MVTLVRSDGFPAPEVPVALAPGGRAATTDVEGEARFEGLAAGEYVVRATDPGGETVERPISFEPPTATVTLTLPALPAGLEIAWGGGVVDWGASDRLRARVGGADPAAVRWSSLDDRYLGELAELGVGPSVPVAPLRPGVTRVEARVLAPDGTTHRDTVEVEVRYRVAWNVSLVGEVPVAGRGADVWVDGEVAMIARSTEGGIVLVSLEGAPREVGRWTAPGAETLDVKGADGVAHVCHDRADVASGRGAITILDVSDPAGPAVLAEVPSDEAPGCHNLWLDGDRLYAAAGGAFRYWDVSDPATPRLRGERSVPGTPHDLHVRDGFAYAALQPSGGVNAIGGRLMIARDDLFPLAFDGWPGAKTHSSWLAEDGVHLYVADELPNAPIRVYDVSNPQDPREVGRYRPRLGATPHNFQVVDDRIAYLSHYDHGIEVVDVSDPVRPRLIGFYDTRAGADEVGAEIHGAFGVHGSDSGAIVVGDIDRGVVVLRYTGP